MATSTRTLIKRLHKRGRTGSEIAAELGVSRQRVHSLSAKMNLTLAKAERKPPPDLGACEACGKPLNYPGTTMHAKCRRARAYVTLKCAGCGIRFKRLRSQKRSKRVWHSPECYQKTRAA